MRKLIDFITIPIAVLLLIVVVWIGNKTGVYVSGAEPIPKMFYALVQALFILGFAMVLMWAKWPWLFELISNDLNRKKEWNAYSSKEKLTLAWCLFFLLCFMLTQLTGSL